MSNGNKKYIDKARRGVRGESFFQALVADNCIPHHVVGPKDLGIDYFCEWVHGDNPTGLLFGVQVKTFLSSSADSITPLNRQDQNGLDMYKICYSALLKIKNETLTYWQGLSIPIYLFAVVEEDDGEISCYYKRYTPLLTSKRHQDNEYSDGFCKVNDKMKFMAFKDQAAGLLGFARDLYIDYMRCCYSKGTLIYLDPQKIGLNQFINEDENSYAVFKELFDEYRKAITDTASITQRYLDSFGK